MRDNQRQFVERVQKVGKDLQTGGEHEPHLPGRLGEWARGRHKPAVHKMLCTDLVIKSQCVGRRRKSRGGEEKKRVHWLTSHNLGDGDALPIRRGKSGPRTAS